ncbi:MAG: hypothetical protein Q8M83_02530 [bacterium]|nr:hypothetical protein [bacterium]
MMLEVYREDLKPESAETSCSKLIFGDFKPEVQAIIRAVGQATFYDDRGTRNETYQVIYSPR